MQAQAFGCRAHCMQRDHAAQEFAEVDVFGPHLKAPGLDRRQVEHVIKALEQLISAVADEFGVAALLVVPQFDA